MANKFNRIVWFGDSWVSGVRPDIVAFPKLVSDNLNLECTNLGKPATGYKELLDTFVNNYRFLKSDDLVVCCLTSCYRQTLRIGETENISLNFSEARLATQKTKSLVVDLSNDYFCSSQAFKAINLIYYMCQAKGVTCRFVNSFYHLTNVGENLTPDEAWLINYRHTLVDSFFDIIEPEVRIHDSPKFTVSKWEQHKEKISEFLIPNDTHPSQLGNEKIAELLADKLKLLL